MECRPQRRTPPATRWVMAAVLGALWAGPGRAQTPLELAVVVNAASPRSLAVANEFIALRGIPAGQVFYLELPAKVLSALAEVTADEFERLIWQPLGEQLQARGLADQVAAWAFSADFPRRVAGEHGVLSLPGAMFFWEDQPTAEALKEGRALSPYFQGPGLDQVEMGAGASLSRFAESLGAKRPRPSALLAWTGARGTTLPAALALLRRGRQADHTWPTGTVFFAVSDDVRSRCRAWQYPQAVRELHSLTVRAEEGPEGPRNQAVAGLMAGRASIDAHRGNTYLPGCLAEHLTSHAASFDVPHQTKLTAWLDAGASASYGTVVEPYAIWTKFPHARFFAHLARGATLLEALAFSVASPVQGLAVGDPLMRPWAAPLTAGLQIEPLDSGGWRAQATLDSRQPNVDYQFFLNGRALAPAGPAATFDLPALGPGWHEAHVVAATLDPLAHWAVARAAWLAPSAEQAVRFAKLPAVTNVPLERPLRLTLEAAGRPRRLRVIQNERVLAEGGGPELVIEASALGAGPVRLFPEAEYAGGATVRGEPLALQIEPLNQPPTVTAWAREVVRGGIRWQARIADPENDEISAAWYGPVLPAERGLAAVSNATLTVEAGDVVRLTAGEPAAVWSAEAPRGFEGLAVEANAGTGGHLTRHRFGLLFNLRDAMTGDFFGFDGVRSEWIFGRWQDGQLSAEERRGLPLEGRDWQRLDVRQGATGLEGWVGDERVLTWPRQRLEKRPYGLLAQGGEVSFRALRVAAAAAMESASATQVAGVGPAEGPPLWLRLADAWSVSWTQPPPAKER